MHEAAATPAWVLLAYLVSGVCFILALRGLSSPESSRRGNWTGMVGMTIAVATTLAIHEIASLPEIIGAMAIGGGIGLVTARKIQMTAMPQLVAAFHSLVGMAAVLVGAAAYLNPGAFGILGPDGIHQVSRIEMGLGVAIGAITFSGSVIAGCPSLKSRVNSAFAAGSWTSFRRHMRNHCASSSWAKQWNPSDCSTLPRRNPRPKWTGPWSCPPVNI